MSGEWPTEVTDFVLMQRMRWTWRELVDTPPYVQRYAFDLLNIQGKARASGGGGDGESHHTVREVHRGA
jgi:hypothetical protein